MAVDRSTDAALRIRCPACAADGTHAKEVPLTLATRPGRWRICHRCRAYFLAERYSALDEAAHTERRPWGQLIAGQALNRHKRRMFRAILDLLADACPPPARLLDVGCSFGGFLLEARARGYAVRGTDLVPTAVEFVRARGMTAHTATTVAELADIADGMIDVVTCLDCNYYWPDQRAEIAAIRRKLRPRGVLLMRTSTKAWMLRGGLALRAPFPWLGTHVVTRAANDHRFCMPFPTLLSVLADEGFRVRRVSVMAALHSLRAGPLVLVAFGLGAVSWHLFRIMLAPGAVVIAERHDG
jgi:SAM-dependent methyltransferase